MKCDVVLAVFSAVLVFGLPSLRAQTGSEKALPDPGGISEKGAEHVPDEVLIGFQPGAPAAERDRARASVSGTKIKEFAPINAQHWKLPPGIPVERAIILLSANPNVRYVEPNYIVHSDSVSLPNDEYRGDLWSMHNIGQNGGEPDADIDALEAWQFPAPSETSPLVVVGVIDSGIDFNHPDLVGRVWRNPREVLDGVDDDGNGYTDDIYGWDFVNNRPNAMDDRRHGTHVAGTIAGSGGNATGVIGVAGLNPRVQLLPIKSISAGGSGTTANAISAVLYASSLKDQNGRQVVGITNNSWGGAPSSEALKDAILKSNTLFVAAAGNSATSNLHYPAAYALENVLAVAATDLRDQLATFSNFGAWVHIAAPGVDILSTTPANTYTALSGTSMAAPHVAGAAALALANNPTLTPAALKQHLINSGDSLPSLVGKTSSGRRLNVANALGATTELEADSTIPEPVSTLNVDSATQVSVNLNWESPADPTGAYLYDIRYSADVPLDEVNWASASPVYGEIAPGSAQAASLLVEELSPATTYYFGVKVLNRSGEVSGATPFPITLATPVRTANLGWRATVVDTVGDPSNYRSYVSLAFNPSGNPVLAYSDFANTRMKVATWNGSSWVKETVGNDFGAVSLAMDVATGRPTFCWSTGTNLYFSSKVSGKWATATVDRNVYQYVPSSLVYDRNGAPAISYRVNGTTTALKYALRSGSTWKSQVVETGILTSSTSLAFTSANRPAIAYTHGTGDVGTAHVLKFAEHNGTAWTIKIIEAGLPGYGDDCALSYDSAGTPMIVNCSNGRIRLFRRSASGQWSAPQFIDEGTTCTLTVDSGNNARIAYESEGKIKLASATLPLDPARVPQWSFQVVDMQGAGGDPVSFKLGKEGTPTASVPHLAYFSGIELRLTKPDPTFEGASASK